MPNAVQKVIPQIEALIEEIVPRMKKGGRLFYIGAGTSGRLGVVDASECPPTFGVPFDLVVGIIAGGDTAIRKAVENAEDNWTQAWIDLAPYNLTENDTLIGIAASGRTPYVIGGLNEARKAGLLTGCVVCNNGSPIAEACRISGRSGSWAGIPDGKHKNEIRYRSKTGIEYDFNFGHDPSWEK